MMLLSPTVTAALLLCLLSVSYGFVPASSITCTKIKALFSSAHGEICQTDGLKRQLLQLGASFDRGFGASPRARQEVQKVIKELKQLNPETNASRGINGDGEASPLSGSWRMIWTSAQDVLVLGASPVSTVGAVYQVFEPPMVTNIIDLLPRAQSLLPISILPSSMLRIKVSTRASPRNDSLMRLGLVFESVEFRPVELLGLEVTNTLPPFAFEIPRIKGVGSDGAAYFEVSYLDEDLLIIQQNNPGGLFALSRTKEYDP